MTLAASSSQLPYAACSREGRMKYSASSSGRNRKRNVGSVKSKRGQRRDLGLEIGDGLRREDQDVLPGQRLVHLRQRKPFGFDLHLCLGHAHLVLRLDRHQRVFLAVLEQHQAATGFQRLAKVAEDGLRL